MRRAMFSPIGVFVCVCVLNQRFDSHSSRELKCVLTHREPTTPRAFDIIIMIYARQTT